MPGISSESEQESELSPSAEVSMRLKSLESEFQDGILTQKGYWKQKCAILDPVLSKDIKERISELKTELDNEDITQKGYFKKLELALAPILESCEWEKRSEDHGIANGTKAEEQNESKCNEKSDLSKPESPDSKESLKINGSPLTEKTASTNGTTPDLTSATNGSPKVNFKSHIAKKLSKFHCESPNDVTTSSSTSEDKTTATASSTCMKDEDDKGDSAKVCTNGDSVKEETKSDEVSVKDEEPKSPDKVEKDSDDVDTESDTAPPPRKKSKGTPPSKTPTRRSSRIKVDASQPSITSMFTRRSKSDNSSDIQDSDKGGSDDENSSSKRQKLEDSEKSKDDKVNAITINSPKVDREKCKECLKFLDDPELKLFPGDPAEALEECLALIDSRLNLFTGDEDPDKLMDETPVHKITNFSVYDKHRHMCPFDMGLIESNKLLFFSGILKPIFEENPGPEDGVPCCDMGPINEWHIAGFDGGERSLIGFTTGYGTYYLMEPSEAYAPVMEHVKVKVHLAKIVIEFVMNNEEATYEDLLNKIQTTVPPPGVNSVSEDSLLRHAQFVVDRIQSFDDAASDDDLILLTTPCIRSLINLAGVTLGKKNKHGRAERRVKKKEEKAKHTMATVTPLVRGIFDSLFKGQIIEEMPKTKKQRCGTCEVCLLPDCGECSACKDMVKFGGSGRSKQACKERRCPNMAFKDAEENDAADEEDVLDKEVKKVKESAVVSKKHKSMKNLKTKVSWVGSPIATLSKRKYYSKVKVNDSELCRGEFVAVAADDLSKPSYVARIENLYEDRGKSHAHVQWFMRGLETVLGEMSDPLEVFMVDECEDIELIAVIDKVKVIHKQRPENWNLLGGIDDPDSDNVIKEDDGKSFFYQLFYHSTFGRFEDIPADLHEVEESEVDFCVCCASNERKKLKTEVILGEEMKMEESSNVRYYNSFRKDDQDYQIGDCCYIEPEAFGFKIKHIKTPKPVKSKEYRNLDEELYPEAYRKSEYVKGSNDECPEPFRIGRISKISCKKSAGKNPLESEIKITVNKFYRVENTHKGSQAMYHADLNQLYWSNEESSIAVSLVRGKCTVVYAVNIEENLDSFFLSGRDRFYFHDAYNAESRNFEDPPSSAKLMGSKAKGGGKSKGLSKGKGKGKGKGHVVDEQMTSTEDVEEKDPVVQKLRTLDVFAGCGGLSEGFHQAGVAKSCWAVEKEKPAAQAFRLNNPGCTVFTEDCNLLLQWVMQGEEKDNFGQKLPQKGDVELLCGGPPCQGFSGMNRFNSREYSKFKNSLIASYLSYCDYYRPRFFLLENVRNFVSFKSSMVLKLTLRCLVRMGYQCTFGVLQAGCYGVAQTRRRAILLAAAPGEKLPYYPEPMHVFSPRAVQLTVMVDDKKYTSNIQNVVSTSYRTITVRDAMSDLPEIMNGASKEEIDYKSDPETHFQRLIRGDQQSQRPFLRDHICKEMSPLVAARMRHIPLVPGSDWRDLPNLEVTLSDNTKTKKLLYSFPDKANGRSAKGSNRGVCSCASGRVCDPLARQFNTLIPWCLPHTGNRHNHWAGLYGRLEWDGFFSTTITNPEPMGKQGRVLHPEQHRVVSVRECARSQGFPDTYKFFGTVLDKHRQVGNAVPPPLGRAVGLEIKKCLVWRDKQGQSKKKEVKAEEEMPDKKPEERQMNGQSENTNEKEGVGKIEEDKMEVDGEGDVAAGASSHS